MVRREATPTMEMEDLRSIKVALQFALDSGWSEKNPASNVKMRKTKTDGYLTWTV